MAMARKPRVPIVPRAAWEWERGLGSGCLTSSAAAGGASSSTARPIEGTREVARIDDVAAGAT